LQFVLSLLLNGASYGLLLDCGTRWFENAAGPNCSRKLFIAASRAKATHLGVRLAEGTEPSDRTARFGLALLQQICGLAHGLPALGGPCLLVLAQHARYAESTMRTASKKSPKRARNKRGGRMRRAATPTQVTGRLENGQIRLLRPVAWNDGQQVLVILLPQAVGAGSRPFLSPPIQLLEEDAVEFCRRPETVTAVNRAELE
jgi:hypothetical protein